MRRTLAAIAAATAAIALALPGPASAVGPTVDPNDDKDRGSTIEYVRHDGGTDTTIELCNETEDPAAFGAFTQNNEPFSVVSPTNPDAGGRRVERLLLRLDGPGLLHRRRGELDRLARARIRRGHIRRGHGLTRVRADERRERPGRGVQRRRDEVLLRLDLVQRVRRPKTNSDVWAAGARGPRLRGLPARLPRHDPGRQGPAAANFFGIFNDKEMVEVDRSPTSPFEGTCTSAGPSSPGFGTPTIRFRASSDEGLSFSPPVNLTEGGATGLRHRGRGRRRHLRDLARLRAQLVAQELRRLVREVDRRRAHVLEGSGRSRTSSPTTRSTRLGTAATGRTCARASSCSTATRSEGPTADPIKRPPRRLRGLQRVDPETAVPSDTSYSSAGFGTGMVGQSFAYISRTTDNGATWGPLRKVSNPSEGRVLPGRRRARRQAGGRVAGQPRGRLLQRPAAGIQHRRCDAVRGRRRRVGELVRRGLDGRHFGPARVVGESDAAVRDVLGGRHPVPGRLQLDPTGGARGWLALRLPELDRQPRRRPGRRPA